MGAVFARLDQADGRSKPDPRLLFYVGIPVITALLFGLNKAGMARLLPAGWAVPYWIGITIPLWLLLDACSRVLHRLTARWRPHRWLVLLGGSLVAMALFSPYVAYYTSWVSVVLLEGQPYQVALPFPEAFLDLRRFAAYSGVPIYWMALALFFARYFGFPSYLVSTEPTGVPVDDEGSAVPGVAAGIGSQRAGFRAQVPYHLGDDLVSLSAEDHYVRVVTELGNALIRYRFSDAMAEVRAVPGIQVHRSHWVAMHAIKQIHNSGKTYQLELVNGTRLPVSRTNVGVLRAANLI